MRKATFVAVIAAAFLAGGILTNMDIAAEAAGGNGNGAWKSLVARVTALEAQADVKAVTLQDDDEGHAVGWNPDGFSISGFTITDEAVTEDSVIYAIAGGFIICEPRGVFEGSFTIDCQRPSGEIPPEGSALKYTVTTP